MPRDWIALNSVNGLGPARIRHLLDRYGTPAEVFAQKSRDLQQVAGVTDEVLRQLRDPALFVHADEQIAWAKKLGVRILSAAMAEFPAMLREIFAPPPILYVKGSPDVFAMHAVAIVGTRRPTAYGQSAAAGISAELAKNNIAIISGLALGIDTCSHQTCLDNNGKTVAVVGCGLDTIYPASNKALAARICEHGALVSEFPLGTPPEAFNFPRRNRIISGLSAGVCVIEAGKKSGALITAHYAVQQGRDIFAVPGSIFSASSEGTFNLIKEGAIPVRSARDIIDNIQTVKHALATPMQNSAATRLPDDLLNAAEILVLNQLSEKPQRMDQIAQRTEKVIAELFSILLNLELKGFVGQVAGQQFVRI
jgi:DNA processing protein